MIFKTKVINSQNSLLPNYLPIIFALEIITSATMEIPYNGVYRSSQLHIQ